MRTVPDEALLWITLGAFEQSPGQALDDIAQRGERLVALLDELGIGEAERTVGAVSVGEEFEPPGHGGRGLGHRARARVAVWVRDPELVGRAISRVSEELRASIDGPHWYVTPSNPARLEAAKLAAADARHKAQDYAEGADAGLGALVRLVEPAMMPGPTSVSRRASAAGSDEEMPTEAEDHEVHASIDATFELDVSRRPRRTRQRPR